MTRDGIPKSPPRLMANYLTLRTPTIERVFTECVMDLKEVIVLDGIDILPDKSGFRVRSHDLHGQLHEIVVKDSGDTFQDKERLGDETCKLLAIVGLREEMVCWIAGGRFLPPTSIDGRAVVGMIMGKKTWLAEGEDFLAAYHELNAKVVS